MSRTKKAPNRTDELLDELLLRLIRILCKRSKIPVIKETVLCQEPKKPPIAQMNC